MKNDFQTNQEASAVAAQPAFRLLDPPSPHRGSAKRGRAASTPASDKLAAVRWELSRLKI